MGEQNTPLARLARLQLAVLTIEEDFFAIGTSTAIGEANTPFPRNQNMAKNTRNVLTFGLLSILSIAAGFCLVRVSLSDDSDGKKTQPTPIQEARPAAEQAVFMRGKLDASSQILEGLLTENSDLVAKGAKQLVEMSAAEKWQVRNDAMYRQHSADFQQSAKKLVQSAEKENFDVVALKWIDTTLKCIECHKFVRGARIADNVR